MHEPGPHSQFPISCYEQALHPCVGLSGIPRHRSAWRSVALRAEAAAASTGTDHVPVNDQYLDHCRPLAVSAMVRGLRSRAPEPFGMNPSHPLPPGWDSNTAPSSPHPLTGGIRDYFTPITGLRGCSTARRGTLPKKQTRVTPGDCNRTGRRETWRPPGCWRLQESAPPG